MRNKRHALIPSERAKVCDHTTVRYTGQIPCTGPLRCVMCGRQFSDHNEVVQEQAFIRGCIGGAIEIKRHSLRSWGRNGNCQRVNVNHTTIASIYPGLVTGHTTTSLREIPLRRLDINPALVGRE